MSPLLSWVVIAALLIGVLGMVHDAWLDDRRAWGGFRLGDPLPGSEHDPDLEDWYPAGQRRAWGHDGLDEPDGGDAA